MPSTRLRPRPKADIFAFEAIGTAWEIELLTEVSAGTAADAMRAVRRRIERFDKAYSRFRADSLVTAMSQRTGSFKLPADAAPMLDFYRSLYDVTDGAVTPLIGQVLADAGYDAAYSLQPGRLHRPPAWDDVLSVVDGKLTVRQPVLLDFGAAGKGYLVDIVGETLRAHGVTAFCIDAGGDILYRGTTPLEVGLEHPDDPAMAIGVVRLQAGALCGSAGNRRQWAGFHHIIDPRKLESPRHIRAVWVTAATTMLADGLTTALYFAPAGRLRQHFEFEYALIRDDFSLERSVGFPAGFFA